MKREITTQPLPIRYLDHIVRKEQVDRFAGNLQEHQKAITADGLLGIEKGAEQGLVDPFIRSPAFNIITPSSLFSPFLFPSSLYLSILPFHQGTTILERAIVQHNMLSASRIYNNITLQELAVLLQISPEKVQLLNIDASLSRTHISLSFDLLCLSLSVLFCS